MALLLAFVSAGAASATTVRAEPEPTAPSPTVSPSPSASPSPTVSDVDENVFWEDGNNVGVITYWDLNKDPMATATGVFEVVGYPAAGEAGVVTVRADFSIDVEPRYEYAIWHAPWQGRFIVGTHATATRNAGDYLIPTEHLNTYKDSFTQIREDRTYGWIKMEVGEDWDREVTVALVGSWHGPETGKVAPPVEEGPNGITVELLDWEETVYDQRIDYSVKVTVDPAIVKARDGARYQLTFYPGTYPTNRVTIPAEGGSAVYNGQITDITEGIQISVWVTAQDRYGSHLYYLHRELIKLGYVNTPAEVNFSLDRWYEDSQGFWWEATINTRSLVGAAGEVCSFVYSSCSATVYAVTDTGQQYTMKSGISVLQRRGDWTTTVTNIGGTALPKRNYVAVFVRIRGQSAYGTSETLDSPRVSIRAWDEDDVRLRAIEVNQAIQDWENSVPLVAGKGTVVRAFLEIEDETQAHPVYGLLYGEHNGVPLLNSPIIAKLTRTHEISPIADAASVRGDFNSSLNFNIPWSWTQEGRITLRFDGGDTEVLCGDSVGTTDSNCSVTVDFDEVPNPKMRFLGLSQAGQFSFARTTPLHEQKYRTASIYPVAGITYTTALMDYEPPGSSTELDLDEVNSWLLRLQTKEVSEGIVGSDTMYVGLLNRISGDYAGLAEGIPSSVASVFISDENGSYLPSKYRNNVPHESGHMLGLYHAADHSSVVKEFETENEEQGFEAQPIDYSNHHDESLIMLSCSRAMAPVWHEGNLVPTHPYMTKTDDSFYYMINTEYGPKRITVLTLDSLPMRPNCPRMGPLGNADTEVWGVDTRFVYPGKTSGLTVIDPNETYALMGYKGGDSAQSTWIAKNEWGLLIEKIRSRSGENLNNSGSTGTTSGKHLLVSGVIRGIGTDDMRIDFAPVGAVDGDLSTETPGDYILKVWSGSQLVTEVPFEASYSPFGEEAVTDTINTDGIFAVLAPVGEHLYTRLEVVKDGISLGDLNASRHSPQVTRVTTRVEETDQGQALTVDWTARDLDGDLLTADVQYSYDGGSTWETIGLEVPQSFLSVPVAQLHGTDSGLVRVTVSDGVLVSSPLESKPFQVLDHSPEILGMDGLDEEAVAFGGNAVWAEVMVEDIEDGHLSGDDIVWNSSLDGEISAGEELLFNSTDMTEGLHIVTVTATDSAGNEAVETGILRVQHPVEYSEAPALTSGDFLGLLDDLLTGMFMHPGTRNPLNAAIADIKKEVDRDRLDHACKALDRFDKLVNDRDGKKHGLTGHDANVLRSFSAQVGEEMGCTPAPSDPVEESTSQDTGVTLLKAQPNQRPEPEPSPSPSPSLSPSPQPTLGVDTGTDTENNPEPNPSPSVMASDLPHSGSNAWAWVIGFTVSISMAAAVGGLWHRRT